jgi:hypothetical protein
LEFHFIPTIVIRVLKQDIKAACVWLPTLLVLQDKIAQPDNAWIFCDSILNPSLVEFSVIL